MDILELETELTRLHTIRTETGEKGAVRFGVLLADDSRDDHFFAMRALGKSASLGPVSEVYDGLEAVEYLSGEGKYADRETFPFPALLLLDVRMPRMDGFDVLAWLRQRNFPDLSVVMLSSSLDPESIEKALTLGADYYQSKPRRSEDMDAIVRRLELFMVHMHSRKTHHF